MTLKAYRVFYRKFERSRKLFGGYIEAATLQEARERTKKLWRCDKVVAVFETEGE
jgi:hypothetical protein